MAGCQVFENSAKPLKNNDMTAAALPDAPASQKSFREVYLVTLGHALTHWYPATFYLLLPLIGSELGLSYAEIGAILTCQAAAGALANVPGGLLVDHVASKGLLMAVSLFWIGAPYLLMGFTHDYWLLLTCAALVGVGNNLWHPTAIPLLARSFPDRRGLAVAIHGMGGNVGDALAPLVVGAMLAAMSWRSVVVLNVLPGMLMAGLILLMLGRMNGGDSAGRVETTSPSSAALPSGEVERQPVGPALATAVTWRGVRGLLGNRTLVLLSVSSAFRAMTQGGLMTFLPLFLARDMGFSPALTGVCLFALQAAGFIAAPIAGHLSDTMGRRRIIMTSMAMTGVVIVFMALAGRSAAFVFFIAVLGFFLFAIRAVMQAWTLDATPANLGGTAIGILFGTQAIGGALGPVLGGILADAYGLMATFYFLAVTIVIANLFVFFTPATATQRSAADGPVV
jgi:FSR family fosmidomycin resistance protein-like MFS transporter